MAKESGMIELPTPYEATGKLTDNRPAVIRVRRITDYGGKARYYMDGLRWPVPAWMRHLDGRTWRGLLLALLALAGVAYAAARLIGGTK